EKRDGLLRQADGGGLFLDEIGDLGADEQAMLLRAIEEKRFRPVGADREVHSDFVLVAGTNRDLRREVREGRFREDLFSRLDVWTFRLPGLAERPADIEPNMDHEIDRASERLSLRVTMSREARTRFIAFATSSEATWPGNFRDLAAAALRMATLSEGGRIDEHGADLEIARLRASWFAPTPVDDDLERLLGPERAAALDRFDRVQLADVVGVCRTSPSLSAAGRTLFAASRARKASTNDADRLKKYLARFALEFETVHSSHASRS
ncbi:MAG: sigma 54-interacting transcriptional regulator, partial [Deltaproteobacteria bacterium]